MIHFSRPGSYNFYHWTIDVLPQLWAARLAPFADHRLLLNLRDFRRPRGLSEGEIAVRLDCLRVLGYPEDRRSRWTPMWWTPRWCISPRPVWR